MNIDVQSFLQTLPIMGKGMAGIFAVTGAIIFSIFLMNKLTNRKKDDSSDK